MKKAEIVFNEHYETKDERGQRARLGAGYAITLYNVDHPNGTMFSFFPLQTPTHPIDDDQDERCIDHSILKEIAQLIQAGYEVNFSQLLKEDEKS